MSTAPAFDPSGLSDEIRGNLGDADAAVAKGFLDGLKPDPKYTVDTWADARRILSTKGSAEPGKYRTGRTPYARHIMECLSPSDPCTEVVWMKAAQIGATEVANNWVGAIIDAWPGPIMMVQPSLEMAKRNSRQRIAPMIDACPSLRSKVRSARERDSGNTILSKEFTNGMLVMIGANSSAAARSYTARFMITDEEEEYPVDLNQQGDTIEIIKARMRTFKYGRKLYRPSTPTVEGASRIEDAFKRGTMKYFNVPCPYEECGEFQVLEWGSKEEPGGVKWEKGKEHEAWYECKHCERKIDEYRKLKMLAAGVWIATNPEPNPGVESFHLNALYSPWFTWGEAAQTWRDAQGPQNHEKLRTFMNTVLGLTWRDVGTGPDHSKLVALAEKYPLLEGTNERLVPEGVGILTCGVDIHADRWEAQVVGAGIGQELWVYKTYSHYDDPTGVSYWRSLMEYMQTPFKMARGGVDYIRSTCVDSGFMSQQVYSFCGQYPIYTTPEGDTAYLWAVKGRPGPGNVWPKRPGDTKIFENIPLWPIQVDAAKEWLYGRAQARLHPECVPGPMYLHWSDEVCDEEYFKQFAAEHCKVQRNAHGYPVRIWEMRPGQVRNEHLDTMVYAYAALEAVIRHGLILDDYVFNRQSVIVDPPSGMRVSMPVVASRAESVVKGPDEVANAPSRKKPTRKDPGQMMGW